MARKKSASSKCELISASDYKVMPWKNGGGTTREIAVDDRSPFRWRITRARLEVPGGPFSKFPGYDRQIVFLGASPTKLTVDKELNSIERLTPQSFVGESTVEAEISTSGEDLNLFILRSAATGGLSVTRFQANDAINFPLNGDEHFLYLIEGELEYLDPNSEMEGILTAGNTVRVTRPPGVNLLNLRTCALRPCAAIWILINLKETELSL